MTRGLGRAAATGLLGALAATVWLALFYGLRPDLVVDFDSEPPRLLTGLYPNEREPGSGRPFAWTGEQVTLRLPGLDRRVAWGLQVRVRGARAQPAENPELTFLADGVPIQTYRTAIDYEEVAVAIPAQANRRGVTLTMRVSSTFVPGPGDRRALGVMLAELRLAPAGLVVPPRSAFAGAALAAAAMGAAIATLGVTAGSAVGGAMVIAAGIASVVARGFGPYTDFPDAAGRAGVVVGLALALGALAVRLGRGTPLRNTARFAIAFSASALLLKLLVLLHPDKSIGDALFHAHRFQEVLAGHLYFTSVAPGNYQFPYAPGLYVFAAAFSDLVTRGTPDMALLRIVTVAADALAATLLYWAIVRARADRLAGACAVAVYHLIPLDFGVLSVGNLTNAFAQSLSVLALVLMTSPSLRLDHRGTSALFAVLLTAAFLSHTSTFAILSVVCFLTAGLFWWRGGPALRASAAAVAASLALAGLLAVTLYYAHFTDTYRTELSRIGVETATAAPDAGGRGILTRLLSVPRYMYLYFGIPALALGAWGASAEWRRGKPADRLGLAIAGWAAACLGFLLLGILTPVDMRHYLAAIPVAAIVAGLGASTGWSAGGLARLTAAVLLAWGLFEGVRGWWAALG